MLVRKTAAEKWFDGLYLFDPSFSGSGVITARRLAKRPEPRSSTIRYSLTLRATKCRTSGDNAIPIMQLTDEFCQPLDSSIQRGNNNATISRNYKSKNIA